MADNELPKPPKAKRNLPTPASPRIRMGNAKGTFVYPSEAKHMAVPDEILADYVADSSKVAAPTDEELYRQQNYDPALKRNQGAIMRAPTPKEKVGDFIRGAYESVAEQPLVRIADMLGLSNIRGVANENPNAMKTGEMPGGPGKSLLGRNRGINPGAMSWEEAIKANAGGNNFNSMGKASRPSPTPSPGNLEGRGGLGGYLTPEAKVSHPALPPEFQIVDKPRLPQSRTAPIDMNNLPSGKMEYLDPDVAEYMNPSGLDVTTREGQRRLRFLTGK